MGGDVLLGDSTPPFATPPPFAKKQTLLVAGWWLGLLLLSLMLHDPPTEALVLSHQGLEGHLHQGYVFGLDPDSDARLD